MEIIIKCRKCRLQLVSAPPESVINAHEEPIATTKESNEIDCDTFKEKNEVFLQEDALPDWISKEVEESQWTKGKLKCSGCESRVGSFDFVSGIRCRCSKNVLPPVHLVKSKIDLPLNFGRCVE